MGMLPPTPERLSTITDWPQAAVSRSPTVRASRSLVAPGVWAQSGTTGTLATTAPLGAEIDASFLFFSAAGQNITYLTTFTGVGAAPQYTLRIRLEYVSP